MLRAMILATALMIALGLMVKTAIAPFALQQNSGPGTADLKHPPTTYGASAVITSPVEPRR